MQLLLKLLPSFLGGFSYCLSLYGFFFVLSIPPPFIIFFWAWGFDSYSAISLDPPHIRQHQGDRWKHFNPIWIWWAGQLEKEDKLPRFFYQVMLDLRLCWNYAAVMKINLMNYLWTAFSAHFSLHGAGAFRCKWYNLCSDLSAQNMSQSCFLAEIKTKGLHAVLLAVNKLVPSWE